MLVTVKIQFWNLLNILKNILIHTKKKYIYYKMYINIIRNNIM